jgi:uncharacterized protein (TIGR03083 family)
VAPLDYPAAVQTEGRAFAAAVALDPGAPVPSCPEWDAAALLRHLGLVHHWVTGILAHGATERPGRELPDGVAEDWSAASAWFAEGLADLVAALRDVDPAARVWNFADGGPASAAFWPRRMAHETSVHRVDAELAVAGRRGRGAEPIERALAADGIAETVALASARLARSGRAELVGTLGLVPDDGGERRVLVLAPDRLDWADPGAAADATVTAPTSGLHLWLLHRHDPARPPVVSGDPAVVAAWEGVRF